MKATARQIEKFENTVRHASENPTCVYAANNVERLRAKLSEKGVDTQEIIARYAA